MGLIMLILIGTVPTAYALNRALPESQVAQFQKTSEAASKVVAAKGAGHSIIGDPRPAVTQYVAARKISEGTYPSLAVLVKDVGDQVAKYGSLDKVPAEVVGNTRNDMYLASEAIRFLMKDKENDLNKEEVATLNAYKARSTGHQVHPDLGQDRGGDRARARHHDRLEAHRRHRRREDRQDAPDLRAGRRPPSWSPPPRSAPPTCSACRSRPRTCCRPASPARWRRTARACRWPPSATC